MAARKLLGTTDTATPDADVIKEVWGELHLLCQVYASNEVNLQLRAAGETTWNNASFNGDDITLSAAGAVAEVRVVPGYEYQVATATAGAEVWMDIYTIKHNPSP